MTNVRLANPGNLNDDSREFSPKVTIPKRRLPTPRSISTSPSLRLIGKRTLVAIPVLWGVTFLTFSLMNLLPGGTAEALAGEGATQQEVHNLAIRLHLNEPFFTRYEHWLAGAVTGHLGNSLASQQPVSTILAQRVPVTAELVFLAMLISVVAAVPVAILAARKPHGLADRTSMGVSMLGISAPSFVLGLVLILVFAVHLRILPAIGYVPFTQNPWANLRTMILPAITLAFSHFARYVRVLRADLADQLNNEEYIIAARAKGIPPRQILRRHALKNAMFPMITLVGLNMGVLIGGTVLVEQIFAVPGIGQELVQAVQDQDVIVVEGIVVVIALAVVIAGLATDLVYAVIDPRIRHGRSIA